MRQIQLNNEAFEIGFINLDIVLYDVNATAPTLTG